MKPLVDVIIPVFNEADSITKVINDIPKDLVREVVVVNNGSLDETEKNAKEAGATVLKEEIKGYGRACLKGIDHIKSKTQQPDIVVFLDGDYSDYPGEMINVIQPIIKDDFDLVIGSRIIGKREKGALLPQAVFGNWVATTLIRWFYKVKFTDLGPFRAIKFDKLIGLYMRDKTFGWTVEMQIKAAQQGLRSCEVPVSYRKRIGISKITGTINGAIKAGHKILWIIFKSLFTDK